MQTFYMNSRTWLYIQWKNVDLKWNEAQHLDIFITNSRLWYVSISSTCAPFWFRMRWFYDAMLKYLKTMKIERLEFYSLQRYHIMLCVSHVFYLCTLSCVAGKSCYVYMYIRLRVIEIVFISLLPHYVHHIIWACF